MNKKKIIRFVLLAIAAMALSGGYWLCRAHRTPHYLFFDGVSAEHIALVRRAANRTVAFVEASTVGIWYIRYG